MMSPHGLGLDAVDTVVVIDGTSGGIQHTTHAEVSNR